jgi:hypothetical protein
MLLVVIFKKRVNLATPVEQTGTGCPAMAS